eukprot:m.251722 g.251722  ORF g.251722 m.251722 type:complete len:63 (-) comp66317_c0_seq1:60-248(-)
MTCFSIWYADDNDVLLHASTGWFAPCTSLLRAHIQYSAAGQGFTIVAQLVWVSRMLNGIFMQ